MHKKFFLFICIMTLMMPFAWAGPVFADDGITWEEYEVYSAVLRDIGLQNERERFTRESARIRKKTRVEYALAEEADTFKMMTGFSLDPAMIKKFDEVNAQEYEIDGKQFDLGLNIELADITPDFPMIERGSDFVMSFSRVVFNHDRTLAIVHYLWFQYDFDNPDNCGGKGYFLLLKKQTGFWTLFHEMQTDDIPC